MEELYQPAQSFSPIQHLWDELERQLQARPYHPASVADLTKAWIGASLCSNVVERLHRMFCCGIIYWGVRSVLNCHKCSYLETCRHHPANLLPSAVNWSSQPLWFVQIVASELWCGFKLMAGSLLRETQAIWWKLAVRVIQDYHWEGFFIYLFVYFRMH